MVIWEVSPAFGFLCQKIRAIDLHGPRLRRALSSSSNSRATFGFTHKTEIAEISLRRTNRPRSDSPRTRRICGLFSEGMNRVSTMAQLDFATSAPCAQVFLTVFCSNSRQPQNWIEFECSPVSLQGFGGGFRTPEGVFWRSSMNIFGHQLISRLQAFYNRSDSSLRFTRWSP